MDPFFSLVKNFARAIRIGFCVTVIVAAMLLGIPWRIIRWLAGKPPRVVHGIAPVHSLRDSVKADRSQGLDAHSAVLYARQVATHDLTTAKEFDFVFSNSQPESFGKQWKCLTHYFLYADIWSSSFCLFWPARFERTNSCIFRLLRFAGIKIIAYPYGTDCAGRDRCRDRFDWIGALQKDYPNWDLREHLHGVEKTIRFFCKYSHLIIGMDGSVRRFLPRNDIYCKSLAVDTDTLKPPPSFSGNLVPVIVHAPNHRNVKGTQFLLDALTELRRQGVKFELKLVEKTARSDAIEIYKTADIIADQFVMGAYGVFALECMALGKPVLTYLDHDHLCNPVFNVPIVNTNRHNLTTVLAVLIAIPELRQRIGMASRLAMEKYQSLSAIGELNKAMYDHLWWGKPLDLDSTRHYSHDRQPRSFTENPSDLEFWPVPVEDLHAQVTKVCAAWSNELIA
jgi:hypothetical protein